MEPIQINIPSAQQRAIKGVAAGVIDRFRESGIDLRKAYDNPMCREIARAWARGEFTNEQFRRACANLLIMNPALASR